MRRARSLVFALSVASVLAGAPDGGADEVRCNALLTAAAVKTAIHQPLDLVDSVKRGEGHLECSWMARGAGGFKSAALTLMEPEAIRRSMTPEATPAEYFAINVKSTEDVSGNKHETLPGIGRQAALIRSDEQLVLYLETAAGFVAVVTNGLTKPQVVALAKAIGQAPDPTSASAPRAAAAATEDTRIEGQAILAHSIGALALEYARLLHAGKTAEVVALSSRRARERRRAMPASERRESDAYLRKNVPSAAELEAGIRAGGVLMVEGAKATLNVTKSESRENPDGSVTASSTTVAMPFEREAGVWKLAQ